MASLKLTVMTQAVEATRPKVHNPLTLPERVSRNETKKFKIFPIRNSGKVTKVTKVKKSKYFETLERNLGKKYYRLRQAPRDPRASSRRKKTRGCATLR
jgi:hypothetical protein